MEGLERLERSPDPFRRGRSEAKVGDPAACLVLDLARVEVVEESVDGQVTPLGVFEGGSKCLRMRTIISSETGVEDAGECDWPTTVGILLPEV